MRVCELIKEKMYPNTAFWLSEETNINYKSMCRKLNNDTFSAYELLKVAQVLDVDLNSAVFQVDFN